MALSPEDQALLAQYRAALAQLVTPGGVVAEVTSNGRTVKYAKTDLGALEREIARLEAAANPSRRRRGAIGFSL